MRMQSKISSYFSRLNRQRLSTLFILFFILYPICTHAQFNVVQTFPKDGVADVDQSEPIKILFSEEPDLQSINMGSMSIRGSRSGLIDGSFYKSSSTEIIFTPDNEFQSGEVITIRLSDQIRSIEGELLEPEFQLSFRVTSAAQVRMSIDETLLGSRSAQSIIRSDQDPELTYEVLLGRAEDLAVDRLGIDVVQVSSYTIGLERATAIQTGWYLSPTTYFGIIHEVYETTPRTLFRLEYALKENLELVLTQGNDRRQGIDLLWGNDY